MIFGDMATIAVEVAPLPDNDTIWHRGAMVAMWIGGERLGDEEASEPLGPFAEQLQLFVERSGERHGAPFLDEDAERILDRLKSDPEEGIAWYDEIAVGGMSRYRLTSVPSLAPFELSGISYERSERLMWRSDGTVSETFISTKQVASAVEDFLAYEADLKR